MKKAFHLVSLLALLLTFAASTAWAEELELSGEGDFRWVEVPVEGQHTLTIPEGVTSFVLESSDDSQAMNSSLMLTAPAGKALQIMDGVHAGFSRENAYYLEMFSTDSLFVYDGAISGSPELFKAARGALMGMLTSSGQNMTVYYKESGPKGRWPASLQFSLIVFVVDLNVSHSVTVAYGCDIEGMGTISLPDPALANTPVTLTVTPNEGYVLEYVRKGSSDPKGYIWYDLPETEYVMFPGNEETFNMPGFDVRVCPEFISESDLQNRLEISTPMDRPLRVEIPSSVQSFIINGGGADNDLSKPMVLTAPEGYLLEVEEGNESYEWNGLFAYDGIVEDGYYKGANLLQGVTSGRNLTLFYTSIGEQFQRTINLVPNEKHDVVLSEYIYHGSISVNPESRKVYSGDTVTLTAQPESGYALQPIRIEGIPVMGGSWYTSNEASFVMPRENVYIYPSFARISDNELRMNMPDTGTLVANVPEDVEEFTIVGTRSGSYSKEAVLVVNAPAGRKIQLGPLTGQMHEDFLLAYDGPDTNSTLLFNRSADGMGKISADAYYGGYVSSTQSVTIVQLEDNEHEFELKVLVVDPNEFHNISINNGNGGTVSSEISSATAKTQVALNVETTGSNVVNWIEVASGNATIPVVGGTWYTSNNASFSMPGADVSVTPHYAAGLTAEDGLSIEKPRFEKLEVTIPDGVESFQINGGINISSSSMAPGKPLILTAPRGKVMQLKTIYGDEYVGYEAAFVAYDGAYDDPVAENAPPMEGSVSSGRVLTLVDYLYNNQNSIIVRLVPAEEYSISLRQLVGNGSVTVNPESGFALAGDTVTLTVTPDEGYVLGEVEVWWMDEDDNRHDVEITGGTWYDNEVKFTMPAADVYYEPRLAYYTYAYYYVDFNLRIPQTGNLVANIPEEVNSFEIYDNGYYGEYSNNSDGSLTITAPEGYTLYVSGSVQTYEEADSLVIYDGADVSATKLLKKFGYEEFYDIFSSGRSLTFHFKSNAEGNYEGLDLHVAVMKTTSFGAVAVHEAFGGKLARIDGGYTGSDAVDISESIDVDWIEISRDFTPDVPSTIVLPFDLPEGTEINADFYALTAVVQNGNRWKATMTYIGEGELPKANTPYAIIPADDYLGFDFDGTATLQTSTKDTTKVSDGDWLFVGTYSNKTWVADDSELGLAYAIAATDNEGGAKKGQFGKISAGASATPFQAYLRKKDSSVQLARQQNSPAAPGSRYSVDFVPEESIDVEFVKASTDGSGDVMTVAKGRWNMRTGEFKMQRTYDIKGRKLNGTPKTHGAYYGGKVLKK